MSARWPVGLLVLAVAVAGCGALRAPGAPEPGDGGPVFQPGASPRPGEGSYDFHAGSRSFSGTWTLWDPTICTIVLGPEEEGDALAQLIITLSLESWYLAVNPYVVTPTFEGVVMPGPTYAARDCVFREQVVTSTHGSQLLATSVTLSTTAHREGTGVVIDGRLYEQGAMTRSCENRLTLDAMFHDYIVGELCFMLDRVIVNPGDEHETIEVRGTFLAVNP